MDINKVTAVYFVGAGGIGMSALIRYFLAKGKRVGGYDKTPSDLTEELKKEGADIHYEDNVALIGEAFKSPDDTLVVYTPAVPESHTELTYFRAHGFEVMKRARVLDYLQGSRHQILFRIFIGDHNGGILMDQGQGILGLMIFRHIRRRHQDHRFS